jgi:hypothetical protein
MGDLCEQLEQLAPRAQDSGYAQATALVEQLQTLLQQVAQHIAQHTGGAAA